MKPFNKALLIMLVLAMVTGCAFAETVLGKPQADDIAQLRFGKLVDVTINEIDDIIVIKAKISPSFSNKATIDQNYYNIESLVNEYGVDQYSELQYWAVADMTDGSEAKVISFDVPQDLMLKLKNQAVATNQLGDYVENLWILPSLLL